MLGAALNFPVTLCMPSNVSPERKEYLAAYGAEVIWTNPADGSDGAIRKARELVAAEPDRYFYADQYGNDENWRAHYRTTANEIWAQTEGQITHFVAGLGTSGTFMGTTRRLRELNPTIRCISMQPDSPFNGLEGLKHMATAIVPRIYDAHLADANIDMDTEVAYAMCRNLGRNQGILVGISAAAAVAASLQVAEQEAAAGREAVIVTILCDSAEKYMSERFWQERNPHMLSIQYSDYEALRAHGEETYPNECCGVLLGKSNGAEGNTVHQIVRAGNTRTDSAHNRYNIAPQELVKIQRQARNLGLDIVGFYHSHPDHPAQWSPTDFAEAHWLGCSYVITAVEKGKAAITNSFLLLGTTEDDKKFHDEAIEIEISKTNEAAIAEAAPTPKGQE